MKIRNKTKDQSALSFIEAARRNQIIQTTVKTLARSGFIQTSLAEIAKEIGVSKGVISYHFTSKDELIEEVINALFAEQSDYIKQQVDKQESATGKLQAYIEASFAFFQVNRTNVVAMVELWGSFGPPEEKQRFNANIYNPCRKRLEKILVLGQQNGEFRSFSTKTLAALVQGAIDGIMIQWVFDENAVKLDESAQELVTLFRMRTQQV